MAPNTARPTIEIRMPRSKGVELVPPASCPDGSVSAVLLFIIVDAEAVDVVGNAKSGAGPKSPTIFSPKRIEVVTVGVKGGSVVDIAVRCGSLHGVRRRCVVEGG